MCEWEKEQLCLLKQALLESLPEETRKSLLQHKDDLIKMIDDTLATIKADPVGAQQRHLYRSLGIPAEFMEPKDFNRQGTVTGRFSVKTPNQSAKPVSGDN